ncbi:hypothetical protein GS3922_07990 [Geobacillus subterraneus]|jgi:hypothetical protein|uniref:Uncharacterized protein n=2 Tax=Geobacillus TaxID=129337 RepID=A0ABN4NGX7_9BACL|nr:MULTISPECIES: hypothetical protein [Geobacillus]AMX83611.1 hypothetical protein GS3922_07990 [Geobacillus subterraneus]KZS26558.1 hypothetical protein A5418_01895 [Geobacillus subterraneus]OXB90282.1 hypothetical protein B9L21_05815 [Geobacillus uzenensis]
MSGNRQEKRQSITPFHLILLVIFLAVFSSFSLILLLINKKFLIDEKSVDLLDMYIRASFVLIGSTLSGIVAFFIFYLQEKSKEREKKENEEKHYENIRDEFEDNRAVLKKVIKIMGEGSLSDLAAEIAEEKEVKEIFLAVYTQLNFTFYLDFLKELKNKEYSNHIKAFKKSYQIYKYLDLIINKLENKENIEQILKLIKDDIVEMNELYLGTIFKDKDE